MDDHTLQQVIDLAVKTAVLKAKKEAILECRPVGSYFLTETEDDPNILFGGGWEKLTGRYVLQCSDDNHKAGTTVEAGLPNITGGFSVCAGSTGWATMNSVSGAFQRANKVSRHGNYNGGTNEDDNYAGVDFNASLSSNIYGKSSTVQPPARIVNVWKRVS